MRVRSTAAAMTRTVGVATAVAVAAIVSFAGPASAATSANLSPAGPYTDGQTITVSGGGFPVHSALPSGLTVVECADPGGTVGGLPTDNTTCDGSTVNPLPVNTDASGNFSTSYTLAKLTTTGGVSNINCDSTHFCVLWVGVDFNNSFTGTHAFSSPFEISAPTMGTPEAPAAIALPVGAALLIGGAVFVARRRRAPASS
jgi:hypothetical protein